MKQIKLSQGMFAIVDDEDFERLNQHKWSVSQESRNGAKWYAIRWSKKVEHGNRPRYKIRLSREVMGLPPGLFDDAFVVDHGEGGTLDNQKKNLTVLTQRQNMERSAFGAYRKSEEPCL